jgi:hypothetical protein
MKRLVTPLAALLLVCAPSLAVVVPNDRAFVAGTAGFLGPMSSAARTYQLLIDSSQISALVGADIAGVRWRLTSGASAAFPAVDSTFTDYDIRLSLSVDPSQRSLTFANNVAGPQTLVRSGPLTIPAGSFPVTPPAPHPFGPTILFNTPYLYTGGDLLLEIRHTGLSGGSASVDAISTSTAPYGTGVSAAWTSSYTGTSGSQGNAVVTEFVLVPEPGTMSLAFGALMLIGARRRR